MVLFLKESMIKAEIRTPVSMIWIRCAKRLMETASMLFPLPCMGATDSSVCAFLPRAVTGTSCSTSVRDKSLDWHVCHKCGSVRPPESGNCQDGVFRAAHRRPAGVIFLQAEIRRQGGWRGACFVLPAVFPPAQSIGRELRSRSVKTVFTWGVLSKRISPPSCRARTSATEKGLVM